MTAVCYWPFTAGIFSAKNDNITAFLPVRFHIAEALRNGNLPLWSPFMYLGYPLHGDMQGGAWFPVVWLLSLFGRYDLTSLHAEILIAVFIAGAGMYRLTGALRISPFTRITAAAVYIMCGYITDVAGSNLPFLWAAAWLPFSIAYYYHLLQKPSLHYAIRFGAVMAIFLASAYPSLFILTLYILLAGLIFHCIKIVQQKKWFIINPLVKAHVWTLVIFLGLAAPVIASYFHVLPHYERGAGVSLEQSMVNSFHPSCTSSILFPNLPIKDPSTAGTDLISKNIYFNIFFLLFLISYIVMPKRRLINFILAGMIFFYLFSLGHHTPVRALAYKIFPLMDTFRHPSSARLFIVLGGILVGALMLNKWNSNKRQSLFMQWLGIAFALLMLIVTFLTVNRIALFERDINGSRNNIKYLLDSLTRADVLFLDALVQLVFLSVFCILLFRKKLSTRLFSLFIIANSFVFAQMLIPFTLSSKLPPSAANRIIHLSTPGFPLPEPIRSIGEDSKNVLAHFDTIGIHGKKKKKFHLTDVYYTPTIMKLLNRVNIDSTLRQTVMANPYAYFAKHAAGGLSSKPGAVIIADTNMAGSASQVQAFQIKEFSSNRFVFETNTTDTGLFCLQQLRLPGWNCAIDGEKASIIDVNHAFMGVRIPPGKHQLSFVYRPVPVLYAFIVSILTMLAIIFLSLNRRRKHA